MKNIIATFILLLSQPVFSEELVRVKHPPDYGCLPWGCTYEEWKLKSDENIRFVISGYEDGYDSSFDRINKDGTRSRILDVDSIIIDSEGNYWGGIIGEILDIPIEYKDGKVFVQATFEHDEFWGENSDPPKWQQRFPVVKFYGKKTGWNVKIPKYNYESLSLEALAESAKQLSQPLFSGELVRVENNDCIKGACQYNEWKLKRDENIRLVMSGEDISCTFYRVNKAGTYSVILAVLPLIIDSQGSHWRGSAQEILDIPIEYKDGKIFVQSTLEHDSFLTPEKYGKHLRDYVRNYLSNPKWQRRIPVVKFYGEKKQSHSDVPKYNYESLSLEALAESAKQLTNKVK